MADPSILQSWAKYESPPSTSFTTTPPSALTPGSTIVALAVSAFGGTVTINSISDGVNGTWPTLVKEYTSLYSGDLYYAVLPENADNTVLAITINVSDAYRGYYLNFYEIADADTTTPVEDVGSTTNGYGTNGRTGSVTTANRDLILGLSYDPSSTAGPLTPDAGYTLLNLASGVGGTISNVVNAGTINPGVTYTGSTGATGITVAIQPGSAPSLPDLTWQGRYPDLFPAQRLLMRREMQAFAGLGKPERKLVYFDAPQPAAVRHPEYERRHSYFAYTFVDRKSPHVAVTAPDRLARPALPVALQMAIAPRGVVERPVAFAEAIVPPRLVRPAMPAALQQYSPPRGWPFEPPVPEPSVTAPASARRAPAVAVQQAYADPTYQWGLAPPAPALSWRGTWPDSLRRPALLPAQQQALAFWPLPDRSLPAAAALMPASVRRSMFLAALQQAYADPTYGWNLVPAAPTLSWRGEQPASVRRPAMPVAEQQAHALPPKPERIAAIAVAVHPDRLIRLFMHASEQQASPRVPLDRNTVLVAVVAPDRVVRAWMPVSEQQAAAGLGVPIVPTPAPDLITAYYPAGALLPPRAPMMSFAAPVSQRGTPASVRIHAVASDVRLTDAATGDTVLSKEKADSE